MFKSMTKRKVLKNAGIILLLLLLTISILFPFYWLIVGALTPGGRLKSAPVELIPKQITIENYIQVVQQTNIEIWFLNTGIIAFITIALNLPIASLAAYALSRYIFRGKNIFRNSILITQFLPGTAVIIPLYSMWGFLGLVNTRVSLIFTYLGYNLVLSIWLLLGFMESIPEEIDEAARTDGCSKFEVLIKMILPLMKSGLAACAIYLFVNVSQEFLFAITFLSDSSKYTLTMGLFSLLGEYEQSWGLLLAGSSLMAIPMIIVFVIMQKHFIKAIAGSVKG